jgi:hypothetical protein
MKTRLFLSLAGSILAMILFTAGAGLVNAGSSGFSVGADGYTVGKVTLSQTEAYYGDVISITGTGQVPNAALDVYMGGIYEDDGQLYLASLGTANTDASGNWSYEFSVPATCTRISDGVTVDVFLADWPVGGVTLAPDSAYYASWSDPDLTVYGERPPAAGDTYYTDTSSSYTAARLPETGSSALPLGLALAGAGLLCVIPVFHRAKR